MRLWGTCLFVAGMLMLLPLQSAVTACDCDFTATISLDDNLASELANETFLYTKPNLSERESIKSILENPAIVGHAEKEFIQNIVTAQRYTNVFCSFSTTKILVILWLIFCFCIGWIARGWFDKWQETHQGNETLLC